MIYFQRVAELLQERYEKPYNEIMKRREMRVRTMETKKDSYMIISKYNWELDLQLSKDNCKNRSEYIEKAVAFYNGYLSTQDHMTYLPLAINSALAGVVDTSESRISRLLFKLTVELSILMNLYTAQNDVDETILKILGENVWWM